MEEVGIVKRCSALVLFELWRTWRRTPELRLGQLLLNVVGFGEDSTVTQSAREHNHSALWNAENRALLSDLQAWRQRVDSIDADTRRARQ